jgi:diaminohydroxyphosphoribosylaminopyrimidine deaminase/5-amino-6-(5-phosphoribosylamino)uracil reductase
MSAAPQPVFTALDHESMALALRLAAKGLYNTKPNPAVGCVLVNDRAIVGSGFTQPPGGAHAERVALAAAGAQARGATAYVTLEPCNHQGRTGPCTRALVAAGVARVVYAAADPNPLAKGGAAALQSAGVAVEGGLLAAAAEDLNRGFFSRMQRGRPWLRSKIAASLDGRTALANGASRWITGAVARRDVHQWRARAGAILTGSGTVLSDDPALTARVDDPQIDVRQPLRVVLDSRLRTPPSARVLREPGAALVLAVAPSAASARALTAAGARVERVAGADSCDLGAVLERLAALEINDLWVEAGPRLNGALLAAGLIDELVLYLAPRLLGDTARGMFGVPALAALDEGWQLVFTDVRRYGGDLRIMARPSRVAGA